MKNISLMAVVGLTLLLGLSACSQGKKWEEVSQAAMELYQAGRTEEAVPVANEALDNAEKRFGEADVRTAYSADLLGMVWMKTGKLDVARLFFERASGIAGKALKGDDPARAHFLNNLAELDMLEGRFDEAESLYAQSLKINQKAFGEISRPVAAVYARMGALYKTWGVYEQAEKTLIRLQAIVDRLDEPDPSVVATVAANLCGIYLETGRMEEAEKFCPSALQARERLLPPDHPDLAQALSTMGLFLLRKGQPDAAEKPLRRAIDIYQKNPGRDNGGLAASWLNMAELYSLKGKDKEAEELYNKVLSGIANAYVHSKSLTRAAEHYSRHKKFDTAADLYSKALALHMNSPEADHSELVSLLVRLGENERSRGDPRKAAGFLERALEANDKFHNSLHPSALYILTPLAKAYIARHENVKAERCIDRIREIAETHGLGHPFRKATLGQIVPLYREMGDEKKAKEYEGRAWTGD